MASLLAAESGTRIVRPNGTSRSACRAHVVALAGSPMAGGPPRGLCRCFHGLMPDEHGHSHKDHEGHGHGHGNDQDQGIRAMVRYARHARTMWWSETNEAVVERLAPRRGETVLDIGAGVGAATMTAAATGAQVIAVEPTGYMRRILGWRRLAQRSRSRILVVDGAAEELGLDAASVDGAWAVNTMHHWLDIEAGCAEIGRVLAPGGRLVLADEDFDDPNHPDHEGFKSRHEGDAHGFHMVDVDVVAGALRAAGLEVTTAAKVDLAGRPVILVEARRAGD